MYKHIYNPCRTLWWEMPFALADWQLGSLTWPVNCLSSKSFVCCRRCRRLQNCESKTNWWKLLAIVARFVLRYIRVLIRNNSKRQTLERKKVLFEPFFSFVLQKRSLNLLMETWKLQLSSGAVAAVLRLLFICNNLACKQPNGGLMKSTTSVLISNFIIAFCDNTATDSFWEFLFIGIGIGEYRAYGIGLTAWLRLAAN